MNTNKTHTEQLTQDAVMLRLQYKLNEYKTKKDNAKAICDKQVGIDVSFEAEIEDEILLLAEKQFEAVLDVVDYVLNAT
jgi:hypothetical protein